MAANLMVGECDCGRRTLRGATVAGDRNLRNTASSLPLNGRPTVFSWQLVHKIRISPGLASGSCPPHCRMDCMFEMGDRGHLIFGGKRIASLDGDTCRPLWQTSQLTPLYDDTHHLCLYVLSGVFRTTIRYKSPYGTTGRMQSLDV